MGSLRELGFFIWITLVQIKRTQTQDCSIITSISSPSASSLLVQWTSYSGATNYILDLRVVNVSGVAPVVVTVSALTTQKEVFGLKPGTLYTVVIKVFRYYTTVCSDTRTAKTVPDTAQITSARAISSTAITLEWDRVASADQYFLVLSSSVTGERYNVSFTNTSTVMQNLRPSTTYDCSVFTANSAGLGARSRVRTVTTLVQPPAVITVLPLLNNAVRVTWQSVDKVLMYKLTVTDVSGTQLLSTTLSSTTQDVQHLLPCTLYWVAVSSLNMYLEPGEPRQVNYTLNDLSSVTSVVADYSCFSASATVTWGAVFGAQTYRTTAIDQNGRTLSYTSSGTSSLLTDLVCGSDYTVWVTAITNNCQSLSSTTAFFQTVPCSPTNLNLFRECSSNVIIFSWAPTNNTAFYWANLMDSAGDTQACITTDNSCFFTDTMCGRSYNFTVNSVNGDCSGPVSPAVSIQAAPCTPTNLITVSDCKTDILTSYWDTVNGATQYIVDGRGNRGNTSYTSYYSCTSDTNSCVIPNVACGESLTMTITAVNDNCYSEVILGQEVVTVPPVTRWDILHNDGTVVLGTDVLEEGKIGNRKKEVYRLPTKEVVNLEQEGHECKRLSDGTKAAPCVPQNLLSIADCSSDSVSLTWNIANGALYYIASTTDSSGVIYTCTTVELTCRISGLSCGTTYHASVISSNNKCNSSDSTQITVETAPCPPSQVHAVLDCDEKRALVSWPSSNFPGSYTAHMMDPSGDLLNCSTVSSSCWVPGLKCGQVYDVSVTYENGICRSRNSPPIHMNSVPCGPGNVRTSVDCSSGVLQLSWDQTYGASGYSASVVSNSDGKQQFCNSSSPSCNLSSLACGESYMVQVRSYNGTCFSTLSQTVTFKEVPCAPTQLTVAKTCSSFTTVTWQASLGAQTYRVLAVGNSGQQATCSSNTTTCSLTGLLCGQAYRVTVVAMDDTCSSLESQNVTLQTAPCAPFNIHSTIQCISNAVMLSWDASPTSVSYTGRAVSSDGHTAWCNSTSRGCQFTGLECGQYYLITLMASDGECESVRSESYTQPTAPCAPESVSNVLHCDTNTLTVNWTQSPLALSYSAIVMPTNGPLRGCNSPYTSCDISGLQCGMSYSLTVMAANSVCTGPESPSQIIETAPCVPDTVTATLECVSNIVQTTWVQAVGALSYTSFLTSSNGSTHTCSTSDLSCSFSGLTCAQTYTLNVFSNNNICSNISSTTTTITTGPCDPYNVVAQLQSSSGTMQVSWQASAGASTYTAQAFIQSQPVPSAFCTSSSTKCTLTQLQCGTAFNVLVFASDGTCNSHPISGATVKTAPCPPVLHVFNPSCIRNQVMVSWAWVPDALDVTLNATSALGHLIECNSANNNCTMHGLHCGERYTILGMSRGPQFNSIPSVPLDIGTVPCTPATVHVDYTCGTNMAVLSWNESLGRENFIARVQAQDHSDSFITNQTHCSFSSLPCGRLYNVSVEAVAGQCNSSDVARTQMQTAPCAPQNLNVRLQCANNTAEVTWTLSLGAIGYDVTALVQDGDVKHCHTSDTYCLIPNMHCSQTYNFVVTPFSDTCTGLQSTAFTFTAGPCPPSGVQVSVHCQNNVGSVSWTAAVDAEGYIATARSSDGIVHQCTTNGTSCEFSELSCGRDYSVVVVSVQRGCWSDPSAPVILRSAICPPTNLAGVTDCSTDDIVLTWDPSPLPGVTYILTSQQDSGANSTFTTTTTSITLNHLQCGWLITVWVAAQDSTCTSHYSAPVQIRTAPCPPSDLAATLSCGTNQANLTWLAGVGGLFYTTTLVNNNGGSSSCTSRTTFCVVKLDCDQVYTATVISSTGLCNSTTNSSTQFNSAPCLISNVRSQLDCTANSLAVQWEAIAGDRTYTALAIGTDGSRITCNSSSTSCTIHGLRCGRRYGIAVTTYDIQCKVEGSDLQVQTAPCEAENTSVAVECSSSITTVRWDSIGVDQSFNVSALNITGGAVYCDSGASYCTFDQFHCGQSYTVTVAGVTPQCISQPSTPVDFSTAPCMPSHITANYDCDTSITSVSWDMFREAEMYVVDAVSSRGHKANCSNTDTICTFSNLQCGQDYNITVVAVQGTCRSPPSQPVTIVTGPCPQSSPQVFLDCSSNSALVSWTPGYGILYYNTSADAIDGSNRVTCSTTGVSCNLTNLQCAQSYMISVSGQGYTCPSPADGWVGIDSGPCPPSLVSVQVPCESNVISISWQISEGSGSYLAVARGSAGLTFNCSSTGTTCDIAGLRCGQTYEVYVSGVQGTCIGPKSNIQIVKTAPCVPQNVQALLLCQSTELNVTWEQSGEATQYRAMVETSDGHVMFPVTDKLFVTIPNILCGLTYNVEVMAQNDKCNSSLSSVQSAVSAPCPPQDISVNINCTSNTISVHWPTSVVGVSYTAHAVSSDGDYTCNSASTSCTINVPCGRTYNVSVIPSKNGCDGAHSPYKMIQAAPCVPTLTSVEIDCLSNLAWVVWSTSAGATSYIAVATDGAGEYHQCNSSDGTCAVPGLQCGRNYRFSVTGTNAECSSRVSNTMQSETVPCAPQGVNVSVGCETGTVGVQWLHSSGALAYTATLDRLEGMASHCTALNGSTACEVTSLPCGQLYTVTVIATGHTCNSSQSTAVMVQTAPCQPPGLNATVSCTNNIATVSWMSSTGGQLHTVNAVSMDGKFTDYCQGFAGSCNLRGLVCGLQYTATLVAQHSSCQSPPSPPTHITTVPCVPQNINLDLNCHVHNLTVSWNQSSGAQFYTATLMDSRGLSTNCQSLSDSCTISGLACGNIYHVSVVASDAYCSSLSSIVKDIDSVPCAPSNIHAQVDILTHTAVLSWYLSAGALWYNAVAVNSISGTSVSCSTNQTNCNLINLSCGDKYNVTVQAVGSICSNSASMGGYLQTGPCVPVLVSVSYMPAVALVMWNTTRGADSYTAMAVSEQGSQSSCSTRDTSCVLADLNCSQIYNINLTAYSDIYQEGVMSNILTLSTEPCPPVIISPRAFSNQGMVTWEPSVGAVSYVVMLEGERGDTHTCETTETSCSVQGLLCGTVYITHVIAVGPTLNSSSSVEALLITVPCLPDPASFAITVQCSNDSASVRWAWSEGATSYELTATNNNGDQLKCVTLDNSCNVTYLECGQTYSLSLAAYNTAGSASMETNITFQSRPCVPQRVNANLQCGTGTAVLTWDKRPGVMYYLGSATFSPGVAAVVCNSSGDSCSFTGLQCGVQYSFSVRAYTGGCWSDFSAPVNVTTEPCQVQNLTVTGSCTTNTLQLNWSSATGVLLYTISGTGNLGYTSSFQTPLSSLQVDVPCGQSYTFSILGQSDQCQSLTSTTAKFSTAPCVPTGVQTFVQCEDSIGSVSWVDSDGAVTYTAVAQGETFDHTHVCITNVTVCSWSDLLCGETYMVWVFASNPHCNSTLSGNTTIRMAPCIPQILSATMDCGLRVASLTWQTSRAAQTYLMIAKNNVGEQVALTTNTTSAQISELHCGQQYYFTVSSVGQGCSSKPSNTSVLETDPCSPTAVSTFVDCLSNIATVTWSLSNTADHYTVNAVSPYGMVTTCMSSTTSCGIATLHCGQKYNITVTASRQLCSSKPSWQTYLKTAPCIPTGVSVQMDCSTNTALVSWNASEGAVYYNVLATSRQNDYAYCNSSGVNTYCTLEDLTCGAVYAVQVVPVGKDCSSLPSPAIDFSSAPCTPVIVFTSLNCNSSSLSLNWTSVMGAVSYTAVARTPGGQTSSCSASITSCVLSQLACGQIYNITVTASDGQCSSNKSGALLVTSEPCPPTHVNSRMNCENNSALVQWTPNGQVEYYEVLALGSKGYVTGCNTTGTSCNLSDLLCGDEYVISVVAINNNCHVTGNPIIQLHSVPCVPVLLNPTLDCVSGAITIAWHPSSGATSYTAIAQGSGGYPTSCSSNSSTCVFNGLLCGLNYIFTVSSSDSTCTSTSSSSVQTTTVPCKPQRLSAYIDCSSSTGFVSWDVSQGAMSYLVQAVGHDGYQTHCTSTNTSCLLPNLPCGQLYNLTSVGQDPQCNSNAAHADLQSVPCVPTDVQATLLCSSNTINVTWLSSRGALRYVADAANANGSQTASCNTDLPSCTIGQLLCGTSYGVAVVALDDVCSSSRSVVTQVHSAPCTPQNVKIHLNCTDSTMTVSWSANPDADSFHVDAVSGNISLSCSTSDTGCSIRGLGCGLSWSVTVTAVRGGCQSVPSAAVHALSAPCIPQGLSGNLDCIMNSVLVAWQQAAGAESYQVIAVSRDGTNSTCSTSGFNCTVPSLQCGSVYTFHVTAMNSWCASEQYNNSFYIETAPCSLTSVSAETECRSSSIRVTWLTQTQTGSAILIARAEAQDLSVLQCNSTGSSCVLNGAHCGMEYAITVSTTSNKCDSLHSAPYYISTAPCSPQALSVESPCNTQSMLVSWARSNLSRSYYLTATGGDGDVKNCNSTTENCILSLHCSQPYTLNVIASDGHCTSLSSQALTFHTTPCAPLSLDVSVSCGNSSGTLSWSSSQGSLWYYAIAVNEQGDKRQCNTTDTSCVIAGLQCGTIYNFSVQASDTACISSSSPVVQKGIVPCPPSSVTVHTQNMENATMVRVRWSAVTCSAIQYLAELNGQFLSDASALVEVASYWTDQTYFEFLMPCDILYSVVVIAGSTAGKGAPSFAVNGSTGYCPVYSTNTAGNRRRRDLQGAALDEDGLEVPEVNVLHAEGVTLHVEWVPVMGATYYTLIVNEDIESQPFKIVLTVEGEVADVPDLEPATRYCVTVSAKSTVTQSAYSTPLCITTGILI